MPTIVGREVGQSGFGLMSLTSPMGRTPEDQAFDAMNAALEAGCTFWNGGQFYGTPQCNSLHLLRDYFTKYPENASKILLSIKGGLDANKIPDGFDAFVRESVEGCLALLPPSLKKIDIFQCARVDPRVPIEETLKTLKILVDEGKIGAIGLSEVSAKTIIRASKIVPIAAVEVEFSLFETAILHNDVAKTCANLNIPIVAYSPLGRGILTGKWTSPDEIPANSPLRRLDKYSGENMQHNLTLVKELGKLSQEHQPHTMAQVALSWVRESSQRNGLPVIVPISGTSKAENAKANAVHIDLNNDDLKKIDQLLADNGTIGDRGYAEQKKYLEG